MGSLPHLSLNIDPLKHLPRAPKGERIRFFSAESSTSGVTIKPPGVYIHASRMQGKNPGTKYHMCLFPKKKMGSKIHRKKDEKGKPSKSSGWMGHVCLFGVPLT